ncbi:hypothetical protein Anas_09524 [Armadillidium nasatum]|uniref:Uncharacterized protein n=1 Tax=Armadillidium nasatum TaxID=96803 RepID=A0A5N5T5E3_9CRUS|nr:hypothetical protein Anas_09524 [Armadillidium nasatum]
MGVPMQIQDDSQSHVVFQWPPSNSHSTNYYCEGDNDSSDNLLSSDPFSLPTVGFVDPSHSQQVLTPTASFAAFSISQNQQSISENINRSNESTAFSRSANYHIKEDTKFNDNKNFNDKNENISHINTHENTMGLISNPAPSSTYVNILVVGFWASSHRSLWPPSVPSSEPIFLYWFYSFI